MAYRPLIIFRVVYLLFLLICSALIAVAVKTDIERIKLDTAADFSSRVQQLDTTISHLEMMATILSQSMTYTVDYQDVSQKIDVLDYFNLGDGLYSLKYISENYQSSIYSKAPKTEEQRNRLELLVKTGAYLPHFLQEERIEKIAVYNKFPLAKLVYPNERKASQRKFQRELADGYWEYFWQNHQQQNIFWKLIQVDKGYKLSLTVSILDPENGLVGLIQFIFSQDIFDQEIYQPSGPDSLVFLSEISDQGLLIATTKYGKDEDSIGKAFNMQEGKKLPLQMVQLLQSLDDWVYQSSEYYLLSVPISGVFNLVYLTDARSFSFLASSLVKSGAFIWGALALIGLFVDRLIYNNLTKLKQKDDVLTEKNQLLVSTLENLEEAQKELIQKEKIVSLGHVVAGLAHQLNTPLSIAITAVSYIQDSLKKFTVKLDKGIKKSELATLLEKGYESSMLIGHNLDKATDLVDNFKLLAEDESEDELNQFNVAEYTQAVLQGLKPALEKRRIKSHINAERDIKIFNYPMSYTQIIVQLLNNAVIHGVDKGGNITINIYRKAETSGAYIEVVDDGRGIDKEYIDKVFEPFFTSKCVAEQVGLGLTIVHNLVLGKMSGEIKVISEKNHGCCFSIYLPSLI